MKIKFLQPIDNLRQSSIWYGGDILSVNYKNIDFILVANGAVVCDIYKDGEIIQRIKDKSNNATFYDIAVNDDRINTDKKLDENYGFNVSDDKIVIFDDTNWWEVYARIDEDIIDLDYVVEQEFLEDALSEMIINIDKLVKEICLEI